MRSPTFYGVRALTCWLADIAVDGIAYLRGQLSGPRLGSNLLLKGAKYALGGVLCFYLGFAVPFLCAATAPSNASPSPPLPPHPPTHSPPTNPSGALTAGPGTGPQVPAPVHLHRRRAARR